MRSSRPAFLLLARNALVLLALGACGAPQLANTRAESPAPDASGWGGDSLLEGPVAQQSIATASMEEQSSEAAPSMEMDVATNYSARADASESAGAPAPSPEPMAPEQQNAKFSEHNERGPAANLTHESPRERDPAHDSSQKNANSEDHRLSLIYDARVQLAVFDTEHTIDDAETLSSDAGGYVVHRDDHSLVFRVPTAKFKETLAAALKLGDVLHREVSVRDVTEEFRDLRIRLKNAEAMRERLEQLLARAEKVDQALEVQRELERIAGEIELIKGKLAMLQELTAFCTITLLFNSRPIDRVDSQVRLPFPWLDDLGLPELLEL